MKAVAFASLVALGEAGSLKLAWTDCSAKHGKVSGLSPDSVQLGTKTTVTGAGNVDEPVSGGTFEIDLAASILKQTFTGDLCQAQTFNLPLGTGSLTWKGLKCPVSAGPVDVPIDIELSGSLPTPLQNVKLTVKGTDGKEGIFCMQINTSPTELATTNGDEYSEKWQEFKKEFGKKYDTTAEEMERFEIFKVNVDFINSMNTNPANSFQLGMNRFADLTADEFAAKHAGMSKPDALWTSLQHLGSHSYNDEVLADSIDWTAKGAVTGVKNQGQCGSCWSFSTTGALEGAWEIATGKLVSLSEQQFVDCDTVDQACSGGLMDHAFKFAEDNALCTEASYPYKAEKGTCHVSDCTVGLPKGSVVGFKDVDQDNMQALMSALNQQPVSIAIEADKSVFQLYKTGVLSGLCGANLDHGVLAVGYGTEDGKDYWKVKNSWGDSWGDNGYVKLLRGKGGSGECGILKSASYPVVKANSNVVV